MSEAEINSNLAVFPLDTHRKFLVTGGNGFIGSHIAKTLFDRGVFVRVADTVPSSMFEEPICHEMLVGNLCDEHFCDRAAKGIDTILHFAATQGGMEQIDEGNNLAIYQTNTLITSNILMASTRAKVRVFLYASSASVYPAQEKESPKEEDAWEGGTPEPQGYYGVEKLVSELLVQRSAPNMCVQIARLHNVFGPHSPWNDGRESAPAAFLRKALAIRLAGRGPKELEIWGDGRQECNLLFINDCVDAVLALLESGYDKPINVCSDRIISVSDLAAIAGKWAGLRSGLDVVFRPDTNVKMAGICARNPDSYLAKNVLSDWTPKVSLEDGIAQTGRWIQSKMEKIVDGRGEKERYLALQAMRRSKVADLAIKDIKIAILLPITSGSNPPSQCLSHLEVFAESLSRTTWRDTHQLGGQRFVLKVYIAIDHDDHLSLRSDDKSGLSIAEAILASQNICNVAIQIRKHPVKCVSAIWRQIAKQAWDDECDYLVPMGDNVVFQDEGWIRDAHAEFIRIAHCTGAPHGFGCVAFSQVGFPGTLTVPVVHRTHLDIFDGDIVPEILDRQDGTPFLCQLYRRWDCARTLMGRTSNRINGSDPVRYRYHQHANKWTFGPVDEATATIEKWLLRHCLAVSRKLTLDIVVPSFRVQVRLLEGILNLKPPATCTTMFIIIIDDPNSPARTELETMFASRSDVCIRTNENNLGASTSRNRGMKESAAEWILFLDDDVVPQPDLLVEAEKVIRASPDAVGFIGNAQFPPAESIFTTAVHLSGAIYFWDIAAKMPGETDMPWGVTANLLARRIDDGVEFDHQFHKTGGGEDVDFCRRKRNLWHPVKGQGFHPAPAVVVTHPWWNGGQRSYHRFYMWARGDGPLIRLHPEMSFIDYTPNSGELLLISAILVCIGMPLFILTCVSFPCVLAFHLVGATIIGNMVHDMYCHLYRDAHRVAAINSTLSGPKWVVAAAEGCLIRIAQDWGRVVGILERGDIRCLGHRCDWYAHRMGDGPRNEEKRNSKQRIALIIVILATTLRAVYQ